MSEKLAVRVHFASSEPEYLLYEDGSAVGFHSCYHDGPLPEGFRVVASLSAMTPNPPESPESSTEREE